jgi:Mg2+/Co2+ transporter CorB
MNSLVSIVIIVVFSLLSAVLSASETAVTMASRLRLSQMAKKGKVRATLLLSLQENMHTLISTIILTHTCLFAGMTALTSQMMSSVLSDWGVFVASLVMGAFMTLCLEVIPKVYAYYFPEQVGLFLARAIQLLRIFLRPLTRFMDAFAHGILQFLGVNLSVKRDNIEDLRGAIDLHTGAEIALHERAMLRSILDLSLVTVDEIMVHRKNILSFNADLPIQDLYRKIFSASYTRIPLWRDSPDNIIGVVNIKNLIRANQNNYAIKDIQEVMTAPWFIPDTSTLFDQLQLFKAKHSHQAFVVDEYGSLLGMVTLEDILEEIVGEITDEHDVSLPGVRVAANGEFIIQGSVTLRDLHRQYDWSLDESNASTLAGLILHETRSIPDVGATIVIDGFTLKILRKHNHQITLVRVRPHEKKTS